MTSGPRSSAFLRRVAAMLAIVCARAATAGVQIDMVQSSVTTHAGQPDRRGGGSFALQIDGARFHIVGAHEVETSYDNGATTHFRDPSAPAQTPLAPAAPTAFDPIAATIEDEHITIGPSVAGAPWNGHATRHYSVDIEYTTVARLALVITRRFRMHDHYEITAADLDASPAALRVLLTRGFARSLALHPAAWTGFPVRIDARLGGQIGPDAPAAHVTQLAIEAKSIAPWARPDDAK